MLVLLILVCHQCVVAQDAGRGIYELVGSGEYGLALERIDKRLRRVENDGAIGSQDWCELQCLRVEALIKLDSLTLADEVLDYVWDVPKMGGWIVRLEHLRIWNNSLRGMWELVVLRCDRIINEVSFYSENEAFQLMVDSYRALGLWHIGAVSAADEGYLRLEQHYSEGGAKFWNEEVFSNYWRLSRRLNRAESEMTCLAQSGEWIDYLVEKDEFWKASIEYLRLRQYMDLQTAGYVVDSVEFDATANDLVHGIHHQFKEPSDWLRIRFFDPHPHDFYSDEFSLTNLSGGGEGLSMVHEMFEDAAEYYLSIGQYEMAEGLAGELIRIHDDLGNVGLSEICYYLQLRVAWATNRPAFTEWSEKFWVNHSAFLDVHQLSALHRLRINEFLPGSKAAQDAIDELVNLTCECEELGCFVECIRAKHDRKCWSILLGVSIADSTACKTLDSLTQLQSNLRVKSEQLMLAASLECGTETQELAERWFLGEIVGGVGWNDLGWTMRGQLYSFLAIEMASKGAWEDLFLLALEMSTEFAHTPDSEFYLTSQLRLAQAAEKLGDCEISLAAIEEFENVQEIGVFQAEFPSSCPEEVVVDIFAGILLTCGDDSLREKGRNLFRRLIEYADLTNNPFLGTAINNFVVSAWHDLEPEERIGLLMRARKRQVGVGEQVNDLGDPRGVDFNLLAAFIEGSRWDDARLLLPSLIRTNSAVSVSQAWENSDFYGFLELLGVQRGLSNILRVALDMDSEDVVERCYVELLELRQLYHSVRHCQSSRCHAEYVEATWCYMNHLMSSLIGGSEWRDRRQDYRQKLRTIAASDRYHWSGKKDFGNMVGSIEIIDVPEFHGLSAGWLVVLASGSEIKDAVWIVEEDVQRIRAFWSRAISSGNDWEVFGPTVCQMIFEGVDLAGYQSIQILHGGGDQIQLDELLHDFGGVPIDVELTYSSSGVIAAKDEQSPIQDGEVGVVACSQFPSSELGGNPLKLSDLPFVQAELEFLQKQSKTQNIGVQSWTGEVSVDSLVNLLESSSIVHVAAHGGGMYDAVDGREETSISFVDHDMELYFKNGFWLSQMDTTVFFPLRKLGVLDMTDCNLVFVSSCYSGASSFIPGIGESGVGSALARAGAKQMILSQWEVDDQASFRFMSEFYNQLFLGNSVRGAFRAVRDRMKAQNVPPSEWLNWRLIKNK